MGFSNPSDDKLPAHSIASSQMADTSTGEVGTNWQTFTASMKSNFCTKAGWFGDYVRIF
jgi:hypothetical protein